jgi:excisionase family DNA binding protein
MENDVNIPDLPGYITVKEATRILGVSDTRVYFYIEKGRLHAVWAGNNLMIPSEEITKLKATIQPPGRPRRNTPLWRISSGRNIQFITQITLQIQPHKQALLEQKLEEIREGKQHLFPGTVARYVVGDDTKPEQAQIILVWRGTIMPNEATRQHELDALQQELADLLDWNTAQYKHGKVFMHT